MGARIAGVLTRYEALCVAAAALLSTHAWAAGRRLGFDELFTFYISRLPDFGQLFRAIPADGNPPLYYLLARISMAVFGPSEFAVRLPSMLAFAGAALATYYFVRRRRGAIFGIFAMLALACCHNANYATEARPYALMLGFVGLTMVSWQAAAEENGRRLVPLLGVAAGIGGAVASHHYGVIHVGIPLALGESVRLWKRRRIDFPMLCAGAAGLSMMGLTLPFAAASQNVMFNFVKQSTSFWAKPRASRIVSYGNMLCLWLPPAFLALLFLTNIRVSNSRAIEPDRDNDRIRLYELAAAAGLALLVPVMIALTWVATGYYVGRYAIGAAMGIAMLAGLLAPAVARTKTQAVAVTALCIALLGGQLIVWLGDAGARSITHRDESILNAIPGREPIVVASAIAYMPRWRYAAPQVRERLHYLADLPFAVHQEDFLPEVSLVANQPYVPSKVDDYRQFVSTHNHFLLYSEAAPHLEWTIERLESEGWSLQVLRTAGDETLYSAEAPRR